MRSLTGMQVLLAPVPKRLNNKSPNWLKLTLLCSGRCSPSQTVIYGAENRKRIRDGSAFIR